MKLLNTLSIFILALKFATAVPVETANTTILAVPAATPSSAEPVRMEISAEDGSGANITDNWLYHSSTINAAGVSMQYIISMYSDGDADMWSTFTSLDSVNARQPVFVCGFRDHQVGQAAHVFMFSRLGSLQPGEAEPATDRFANSYYIKFWWDFIGHPIDAERWNCWGNSDGKLDALYDFVLGKVKADGDIINVYDILR